MPRRFDRRPSWRWIALVFACAVLSCGIAVADQPQGPNSQKLEATSDRINKLIEQLGSDDFGAREKAQSELAQLGLEAHDALHAAQNHHDPEIALRARYLVRSMSVRWFSDSDSPKVIQLLKDYGDLGEHDRRSRIDRLAALENGLGIVPLIRLSRFETIDSLAKYAALKILELPPPDDEQAKRDLAANIGKIVESSKRPAAAWLRLYGQTLVEPLATLTEWEKAVAAEHAIWDKTPERSSREIVRDLYRYQVELLKRLERDDDARAVIHRTFKLIDGSFEQVQETVDWLMHRESWSLALEVMDQFSATVQDNARLLYRLAAIFDKLNEPDKAAAAAAKALALRPENLDEHILVGHMLEETPGLGKWAEAEYRQVLQTAGPGSIADFSARFRLSELLHDHLQSLAAAEILKPVVERMQKDEAAKETCYRARRAPEGVIARMHYLFACHYREQGDFDKEKERLKSAIDSDPDEADVLIAMYRFTKADEEWKKMTREKIEVARTAFRAQISDRKAAMDQADSDRSREEARGDYAFACNQYAWLVGNTYGDYDEAVKLSQEAVKISSQLVELKPSYAGYLDTLGRCFYAAGDIANAIKHQSMAVALSPDSGQIRRQLEFFQKEASK